MERMKTGPESETKTCLKERGGEREGERGVREGERGVREG